MILIDTNVISELMKPNVKQQTDALDWFDRQENDVLYLSSVTGSRNSIWNAQKVVLQNSLRKLKHGMPPDITVEEIIPNRRGCGLCF